MTYRFVHAADLHLDSPLRSLALRNAELAGLISNGTRQALIRIVDLCLDEQVDALILAGDLYDGEQTSMMTARFLADQLHRLHVAGIRVFVIRGNHDALSKITKELIFPDTVKLYAAKGEFIAVDRKRGQFPVAIHGLSFAQPRAPESLLGKYRSPVADAVNIGIMHTSLGGNPDHDHYAPCNPADLHGSGFRYWALGHIHKRSVVEGNCTIVMPGMPQGRDINEAGPKSVSLVTIRDDRSISVEERVTSIAQFERVEVDVTGIETWQDVVAAVAQSLAETRATTESDHLVARVKLTGATELAWQLRRDLDLLKTEAELRAFHIGRTWIEKLEVASQRSSPIDSGRIDPIMELRRLITSEVIDSDAYKADLLTIAEELKSQLPPLARDSLGKDEEAFTAALSNFARDGAEEVLARLQTAQTVD